MKSVLRPPPQLNREAGKVGPPATRQFGRLLSLLRAADFVLPEERKKTSLPSFRSFVRSFPASWLPSQLPRASRPFHPLDRSLDRRSTSSSSLCRSETSWHKTVIDSFLVQKAMQWEIGEREEEKKEKERRKRSDLVGDSEELRSVGQLGILGIVFNLSSMNRTAF